MKEVVNQIHEKLEAEGIPIHGVSKKENVVTVHYKEEATEQQRLQGNQLALQPVKQLKSKVVIRQLLTNYLDGLTTSQLINHVKKFLIYIVMQDLDLQEKLINQLNLPIELYE